MRTQISSDLGKARVPSWEARALSRETQREVHQEQNDYTEAKTADNRILWEACLKETMQNINAELTAETLSTRKE